MHGNAKAHVACMVTKRLDALANPMESAQEAAELLRNGKLVAIPTETVYGLAACIGNDEALAAIFHVKQRPADNPLIVHVAHRQDVNDLAEVDALSARLIESFWPGALTIVLPRKSGVSDIVTAGLDTVAVRMPSLGITRAIIDAAGEPLAAPSANISGRPSATTADHVLDDFGGHIAAVVDAGPCEQGIESTVVRVESGKVIVLRPGGVTRAKLAAVVGDALADAGTETSVAHDSPGTRHRHYAPRATVVLCETIEELRQGAANGVQGLVLILAPVEPELDIPWCPLTASTLFAELRRADDFDVDKILVHCTDAVLLDEALMNRLRKAAEPFRESGVDQ